MGASTGSGKGVLTHTFLEDVCLALEGDQFHPREKVLHMIELGLSKASLAYATFVVKCAIRFALHNIYIFV